MKDDISRILREYIDSASPEQLRELAELMKGRDKKVDGLKNMAMNTAAQIGGQLKVTDRVIKNTARNLVATLARQYKPDFTDREIDAIVNELVPDQKKQASLPPEMVLVMVGHFIDYSKGRMPEDQARELPKGWEKKYWNSFGPEIRRAIADHLKGDSGEGEFWRSVRAVLGKG